MKEAGTLPWDLAAYMKAARKAGACKKALEALAQYDTMGAAMGDENAAEWAYWTAVHVPGADVKALESVVVRSGKAEYAYHFACDVLGADVKVLQDAVVQSGEAGWAYIFALHVPGADAKTLQDAVVKSGNAEDVYYFAKDVPGADVNVSPA